jgi:predicted transcriptional regulator
VGAPAEPELVMLCVRVPPSLRRRLKLIAAQSGRPIQALATEALEQVCMQRDM